MPTIDAQLAWCVEVDIVQLGSSFEAFVNLQSTFITLRLCCRYGKGHEGHKAAVTRLPLEVLERIEQYLLDDERHKLSPEWIRQFKCWDSTCLPHEHFPPEVRVKMYNDIVWEWAKWEPFEVMFEEAFQSGQDETPPTRSLTRQQLKRLDIVLSDLDMGVHSVACEEHFERKTLWEGKVGEVGGDSRGIFTTHSKLFSSRFGLNVWISHVQKANPDHIFDEADDELGGIFYSTKAYLTLPSSISMETEFGRNHDSESDTWLSTGPSEAGATMSVTALDLPSKQMFERFSKAMRFLRLSPVETSRVSQTGGTANPYGTKKMADASTDVEGARHCGLVLPELKVLFVSKDVTRNKENLEPMDTSTVGQTLA